MAEPKVKAIVLAGSYRWSDSPFERALPRPLLPVALRPLIWYSLEWLRAGGVSSAIVCTNRASRSLETALPTMCEVPLPVEYREDAAPRGTAGCLRDAGLSTQADTFVVADGTSIPSVDLEGLLAAHRSSGAAMTVVAHREAHANGEQYLSPGGVYVLQRRALEQVPADGFQDVKESLIPRLHRLSEPVRTYATAGACPRVLNLQTYVAVNQWMVSCLTETAEPPDQYVSFGYTVAHVGARLARTARLVGPVLIGPSTRILEGATIVGPAVIGEGCTIGAGALVSRSILWDRCSVGADAIVDRSVVTYDSVLGPGQSVLGVLRTREQDRATPAREAASEQGLEPLPSLLYPRALGTTGLTRD